MKIREIFVRKICKPTFKSVLDPLNSQKAFIMVEVRLIGFRLQPILLQYLVSVGFEHSIFVILDFVPYNWW